MKRIFFWALFLVLCSTLVPAGPVGAEPETPASFDIDRHEIDFGVLKPGKIAHASVAMVKTGSGQMEWMLEDPPDWRNLESRSLQGRLTEASDIIVIALKYDRVDAVQGAAKGETDAQGEATASAAPPAAIQMVVLVGNADVKYGRGIHFGSQQVVLKFKSGETIRQINLKFEIPERDAPVLRVDPVSLDFGTADAEKMPAGQFKITNPGTRKLVWKVVVSSQKDRGRFIPLYSEESRNKGVYVPVKPDAMFQVTGNWREADGYPCGGDQENPLVIEFTGTGAILSARKDIDAGTLAVYLDDAPIGEFDCRSEKRGLIELPLGGKITEGVHRLTVKASGGDVVLTGIRLYGKDILSGPPGWIKVFPEVGDTTSETDYVNVRLQTDKLEQGFYAGTLLVQSNGGEIPVDISVRVLASNTPRILNVYKYTRGLDFLYTSDPAREDRNVLSYYRNQGFAFRLFKDNTPGTRKLFRWYHPQKGDHFYSSDPEGNGAKALYGYIFEGSIGNIATSKLPGTRELYCWYNAKTGLHFYTLDVKGEGFAKKGYKFEAIVGYVR